MLKYVLIVLSFILALPVAAQTSTCRNATTYGADPTGASSSNAAFTSALASTDGLQLCVYFPAGNYRFNSTLVVTLPATATAINASITIKGDGPETTKLRFDPAVSGIYITINGSGQSFHISDLSVLAGDKNNSTNGIYAVNASSPNPSQSHIDRVTVRGADGYHQQYRWGYGISLGQFSNVNITNTSVFGAQDAGPYSNAGVCMIVQGLQQTAPVQINVVASQFNYCKYGVYYGNWVQGLQISTTNFVGDETGIYLPAGMMGTDQLAISSSQFNNGQANISLNSTIDAINIVGNDFYGAATQPSNCIVINNVDQYSITANSFINTGIGNQNGIIIGNWVGSAGVITGNTFKGPFSTAIWLQSGSQFANVQSNVYYGVTNQILNQGLNNRVGGGSN